MTSTFSTKKPDVFAMRSIKHNALVTVARYNPLEWLLSAQSRHGRPTPRAESGLSAILRPDRCHSGAGTHR